MARTCIFCHRTNTYVCTGEHCGACEIDEKLDQLPTGLPSGMKEEDYVP